MLVMIRDHLRERRLRYQTSSGVCIREVIAGAAQGSVLVTDPWNISYDSLLQVPIILGVSLVSYADDVITTLNAKFAQTKLGTVMKKVNVWMEDHMDSKWNFLIRDRHANQTDSSHCYSKDSLLSVQRQDALRVA